MWEITQTVHGWSYNKGYKERKRSQGQKKRAGSQTGDIVIKTYKNITCKGSTKKGVGGRVSKNNDLWVTAREAEQVS